MEKTKYSFFYLKSFELSFHTGFLLRGDGDAGSDDEEVLWLPAALWVSAGECGLRECMFSFSGSTSYSFHVGYLYTFTF